MALAAGYEMRAAADEGGEGGGPFRLTGTLTEVVIHRVGELIRIRPRGRRPELTGSFSFRSLKRGTYSKGGACYAFSGRAPLSRYRSVRLRLGCYSIVRWLGLFSSRPPVEGTPVKVLVELRAALVPRS